MTSEPASQPEDRVEARLLLTMFRDADTGLVVMDVTEWPHPVDWEIVRRLGSPQPLLACFGGHEGDCPLDAGPSRNGDHGVLFDIPDAERRERVFLDRFRTLSRRDLPIRVQVRGTAAAGRAPDPAGTRRDDAGRDA